MSTINPNVEKWFLNKITSSKQKYQYFDVLKNVSIVVPSFNRQDFILRQIVYWYNSGVKLIIIDGTDIPLSQNILDKIDKLENVTYLHLAESLVSRLNQAIKYISTPYASLLSDDEFFLKGALKNLVYNLDDNVELCGCIGQSLVFDFDRCSERPIYSDHFSYFDYKVMHDNAKDRMNYALSSYKAAFAYGLYRTVVWQNSWTTITIFSSPSVPEIHQLIIACAYGKYKTINELYWLRSEENKPVNFSGWNRSVTYHDWWIDNKFKTERIEFIQSLTQHIIKPLQINKEEAKIMIETALKIYGNISLKSKVAKILKLFLPNLIFLRLQQYFGKSKQNITQRFLKLEEILPYLNRMNNLKESKQDIMEIEIFVKEFYLVKL